MQVTLDAEGMKSLTEVAERLQDLNEAVQIAKTQESQVEAIEGEIRREIRSFKSELDKKMAKGLGVILTTTDRKVDKAIESCASQEAEIRKLRQSMSELPTSAEEPVEDTRIDDLIDEVEILKDALEEAKAAIATPAEPIAPVPQVQVVGDVAGLEESLKNLSGRVKRIEDYLVSVSKARRPR